VVEDAARWAVEAHGRELHDDLGALLDGSRAAMAIQIRGDVPRTRGVDLEGAARAELARETYGELVQGGLRRGIAEVPKLLGDVRLGIGREGERSERARYVDDPSGGRLAEQRQKGLSHRDCPEEIRGEHGPHRGQGLLARWATFERDGGVVDEHVQA